MGVAAQRAAAKDCCGCVRNQSGAKRNDAGEVEAPPPLTPPHKGEEGNSVGTRRSQDAGSVQRREPATRGNGEANGAAGASNDGHRAGHGVAL